MKERIMNNEGRPIVFAIHQLHPWGGHDKSTLEIAKHLPFHPLHVLAYSVQDHSNWEYRFHRVAPEIKRPALLMMAYFWLASTLIIGLQALRSKKWLVHATGTCSLLSDVVQIQFLQTSWQRIWAQSKIAALCLPSRTRGSSRLKRKALSTYFRLIVSINAWIERLIYTHNKTYIVLSNRMKQELASELGLTENVHVIYHGVDASQFQPNAQERERVRKELKITPNEVLILLVGELERKGLASALHGLAQVPRDLRQPMKLLAVGAGNHQEFRNLAIQLGLESQLLLLPPKKDIQSYYQASDVFLLPTYYEPFGLVILEAMATGLPCIVSEIAGAAELIQNEISGLILKDPTHFGEIALALSRLCDQDLRRELGNEARKIALERPWSRVAKEYEEVLLPLLKAST